MSTLEASATPDTTVLTSRVIKVLRERLDLIIDDPSTDLFATGLVDSLGLVTLLETLEHEFGLTISVDDLEIQNFSSVSAIVEFVVRETSAQAPDRVDSPV